MDFGYRISNFILLTGVIALSTLPARAEDPVAALDRAVARAAELAAPAVVALEIERDETKPAENVPAMPPVMPGGRMRSLLDYYSRPRGPVSGVVIDSGGLILTTLYNVQGTLRGITATLNGRRLPATLLGWSELHDVALLSVDARDLAILPEAPADTIVPGRICVHVGRSPVPARPTVSWGIVSALRRWDDTALQTDAEMNFGSAGGAVVDLEGRLLGIASHIADRTVWGQSSGVGFVTPWPKVRELLPRLKAGEKIERRIGYLGVVFSEEREGGVPVSKVAPDTPAAEAGLQVGDVILEFADRPVTTVDQLVEELRSTPPGTKVKIKFKRGEETKEIEVTLINKPVKD